MGATRRDFIVGAGAAALSAGATEGAEHTNPLFVDGVEVTDEEKDVAKEAIAVFLGSFPAGSEPDAEQMAARGKSAVRAWRAMKR